MTGDRTSGPGRPPHGSAAEEAARLVEELGAAWARRSAAGPEHSHSCPEPTTCRVCPVCQGAALLRGLRPEVVEHLVVAATALAAAVRELVPAGPERSAPRHPAEPDVELIRVSDDEEEPDDPAEPPTWHAHHPGHDHHPEQNHPEQDHHPERDGDAARDERERETSR